MYWSSPLRSTLNTGYITVVDMCQVCTEAVCTNQLGASETKTEAQVIHDRRKWERGAGETKCEAQGEMFLKHKVGCFFSFFAGFTWLDFYIRWIQHVVDPFCIFAVVLLPCLLLWNYKMLKCSTAFCVRQKFSAFKDYLNKKLRLAQVSLDSTVLISIFAGFNMF